MTNTDREQQIRNECAALADMLVQKNAAYGDSALNPVRVFSRADPVEQLRVRIDDKLSRIMHGTERDTQAVHVEDTVLDLLGYLVLFRIATRKLDLKMPEGWNDPRQEPREDVGFALTDAEAAEAERAVGYMPRDGAGFDGPMTQVIETALALETIVSDHDSGRATIGKWPSESRDIMAHHAAKLRAYAAREFARLEPKTTG